MSCFRKRDGDIESISGILGSWTQQLLVLGQMFCCDTVWECASFHTSLPSHTVCLFVCFLTCSLCLTQCLALCREEVNICCAKAHQGDVEGKLLWLRLTAWVGASGTPTLLGRGCGEETKGWVKRLHRHLEKQL